MNCSSLHSFSIAHWCILIAALLPLLSSYIAKWGQLGKPRRDGGYDNADPRAWLARQGDWRARANAAQANSFEALPFFIGAVVVAHQLGAGQTALDLLAMLYVLLRLEQTALLVGAVALFAVLALVMLLTRKVDWYSRLQVGNAVVPTTTPRA